MLDHDQRVLAIDLADDLGGSETLFLGHAGGGFVEQDQIGAPAQHQRELHPLPLAVRELADRLVGETAKAQSLDLGVNGGIRFLPGGVTSGRDPEILPRGESIEHARNLGLDADAEPGDFMGLQLGDVDAAEQHGTASRFDLAGQELEESALARAVRSDQTTQLAFGERKVDVANRLDAAEMFAQGTRFDQRRAHALPPCAILRAAERGRRRLSSQGTR